MGTSEYCCLPRSSSDTAMIPDGGASRVLGFPSKLRTTQLTGNTTRASPYVTNVPLVAAPEKLSSDRVWELHSYQQDKPWWVFEVTTLMCPQSVEQL